MAERKLETLVEQGKAVVETQEERVARMAKQQELDKQERFMREVLTKRKENLRSSIDAMRLELEYITLQNDHADQVIRQHNTKVTLVQLGLMKEKDDNNSNTNTEEGILS